MERKHGRNKTRPTKVKFGLSSTVTVRDYPNTNLNDYEKKLLKLGLY